MMEGEMFKGDAKLRCQFILSGSRNMRRLRTHAGRLYLRVARGSHLFTIGCVILAAW